MKESHFSDYVLIILKDLNLMILLYLSMIMAYSLSGYVRENSAAEFLSVSNGLPPAAWKIPVLVLSLYACCLLLMRIRQTGYPALVVKVCAETGISFLICYLLGFSYTGLVLLILADTLRDFPDTKRRFTFVAAICAVYLIIDFDLLSVYYDIVPLDTYLSYFQSDARSMLLGIKNIFNSLNTFVFFVYIILLVSIQLSEKERVMSLNTQLNDANMELQKATVQLAQYAREAERMVQTRERNRLAREIHDTLGHTLTGIITGIEACMALMDVAPEATKLQLKAIADVGRQGITDVRRSVKALRPDALEKADLAGAVEQTIEEMRTATGVHIDYQCETRLDGFNDDEEDVIYRIVQESITNSIRHGKADHIWITISREYNLLSICVRDNGIGGANIKKGFGLHHMEERLSMLNGTLAYDGSDGFVLEAQIPIRWGRGEMEHD